MKNVLRSEITIIYISSLLAMLHTTMFAQAPEIQWTKTYGEEISSETGIDVQSTDDGGYIVLGGKSSQNHMADIWLIKTDANGDTIWTKTFGDTLSEYGYSLQQTNDGGYIISGVRMRSWGYYSWLIDVWLVKTDINGDTTWTKTIGDSAIGKNGNAEYGHYVQQTSDGGYIIVGNKYTASTYEEDIWLIKTDTNGDTVWTKTFGDTLSDYGIAVQQTDDGGYVVIGTKFIYNQGNDIWLIKTDANGDTMWTKGFGRGFVNQVGQTSDGGYILIGTKYSDIFEDDIWLIKTDTNGDTIWTKTLGNNQDDHGVAVQQTDDGGYIAIGKNGSGEIWLIKIAPDVTTTNEEMYSLIDSYQSNQNYPNPFNPLTTIEFTLPKSEFVELKVSNKLNQGNHTYTFDGKNLASGIYYYQLVAGEYREVKKMILIK